MVISMWIATHFQDFLKFYIDNFGHSTQFSSLIVPAKHHLKATECFLLTFYFYVHIGLFQLALGPSETIYPKNSFRTTHNVDTLETSKPKKLFRNCHNIFLTSFLYFWTIFVFQATPRIWSISENISKNHQVWTNFGPRSPTVGGRDRPPFVENIANCHMPHCLSF